MLMIEEGGPDLPVAAYRFIGGEPTIYSITPDRVLQAVRFEYQAVESGVGYALVVAGEGLKDAPLIAKVAGQWAATWNANAKVPGVEDIAETQEVRPLGALEDVVQVAVSSSSGRLTEILTLDQYDSETSRFAEKVAAERARLDTFEGGG
jgi:hypothetical protein